MEKAVRGIYRIENNMSAGVDRITTEQVMSHPVTALTTRTKKSNEGTLFDEHRLSPGPVLLFLPTFKLRNSDHGKSFYSKSVIPLALVAITMHTTFTLQ